MKSKQKFGTAINCIDGRVQLPLIEWLKKTYFLDYVDMITVPGPDKVLSGGNSEEIEALRTKAAISIKGHGSDIVAIAGHYDCAGNPVSKKEHLRQIRESVEVIDSWGFSVEVVGLWIGEKWGVEIL